MALSSLSKLSNPARSAAPVTPPAATPPAAAPAEVVLDAQPAVDANTGAELSIMPDQGGVVSMADVLNTALSTDSGRAGNSFGIVNLGGGPSGGMFAPAEFLPQEVQDTLPSGKKPIPGVLMGYRLAVSAWPVGYLDSPTQTNPAVKDAGKSKPVYAASISANDASVLPLAMKAARNYQFTKSADKAKFDYATSSAGHIRLAVELLVYSPELGQPIVLCTPANYGSVEATLQNVQKLIDPKSGQLGQFPCTVRPVTEDKTSKGGFTWKQHSLDITNVAGQADGAASWNSYGAWKQEAVKDPATVQAVRDWVNAQDRKADAQVVAALKAAAAL